MNRMSSEEFMEKLSHKIAGETINWYMFERYLDLARPKTLSTLMRATKAEAYMEAIQDKYLTPRQKIALVGIFTTIIIVMVIALIAKNMGLLPF